MDASEYNDCNRAFIQAFMSRSTMTLEQAQPVLAAILSAHENRDVDPTDITLEHLSSFISQANTAISPFDLEIRSSLRQDSKDDSPDAQEVSPTRIYALVNTTSDPMTQLATTYSADEIAFVKRILDYMFVTKNNRLCEGMVIHSIDALNLSRVSGDRQRSTNIGTQPSEGGAAQSLSMTQAEDMMKNLVKEGWLEKSRKDYFSLTPRALMELRGWLVATYNDEAIDGRKIERIKFCAACREIITSGQRCGERDCSGRLHDHCMRNFFRMQQAEDCPTCKKSWPGDKYVGERAVMAMDRRRSRTVPQNTASSPRQQNGHVGSDDENMSDEEEG
ncbi:DNA repair protein Nse1 [Penicillium macrosclerotiorum]|uniref:DNA repair protein Nse1 n=1 Tax=Penicillium macrosclerotiorum TaxID=303699 RepID=UPI00254943C3|nr:DNA repair protein Nse1 [Penicillium macrosclerotiorum]KAJ5691978.1 DNA repair protein Nse1 [Penicillium macrosclerotiorum]